MANSNNLRIVFLGLMAASIVAAIVLSGVALWPEWRFWRAEKATEAAYKSGDPIKIQTAMEILGNTRDIRAVPSLIEAMYYEDDANVQLAAHKALCQVGSRPKGFGTHPPEEAIRAEWEAEIGFWKSWYRTNQLQTESDDLEAASAQVQAWREAAPGRKARKEF